MAVAGCGNALVPGDVVRAPIFSVAGVTSPAPAPGEALRVAALWVDPLGSLDDRPWPLGVAVDAAGSFQLDLAAAPPAELIRNLPSSMDPNTTVASFAFAELVAFDDRDGDGTFSVGPIADGSLIESPDVYRGTSAAHALFYVAQPDTAASIPELDAVIALPPGYHLAEVTCDPTAMRGRFEEAMAGAQDRIPLVPDAKSLPESRGCLRSHVPTPAP